MADRGGRGVCDVTYSLGRKILEHSVLKGFKIGKFCKKNLKMSIKYFVKQILIVNC